jgi:hypothetical protein
MHLGYYAHNLLHPPNIVVEVRCTLRISRHKRQCTQSENILIWLPCGPPGAGADQAPATQGVLSLTCSVPEVKGVERCLTRLLLPGGVQWLPQLDGRVLAHGVTVGPGAG